jgi:hypothetical protein
MKIILIPVRRFLFSRHWLPGTGNVLDIVGVPGNKGVNAVRPKRGNDAGRPAAPIISADDGAPDIQRIHQRQQIRAKRGLLSRSRCISGQKSGRPIAPQTRHDHPRPSLCQDRRRFGIGMNVVRKAVTQNARPTIPWPIFVKGDFENIGFTVPIFIECGPIVLPGKRLVASAATSWKGQVCHQNHVAIKPRRTVVQSTGWGVS